MKARITLLLLLCTPFLSAMHLFSQITLENNRIRSGDEIIKQQVKYKDAGRSGVNVLWDFSSLEAVNPEYKLQYTAPRQNRRLNAYLIGKDTFQVKDIATDELVVGIEHRTRYYYRIRDNVMYCLGHENPTTSMNHSIPLPVIPYPFSYGQQIIQEYRTEGFYSSLIPMSTYGEVSIQADAVGRMILPSKDTLRNVIRIKTVQTIIEPDSITEMENIPVNMLVETYRWYSKGYRYPVFETIKSTSRNDTVETVFTTAFFYPPQEHYYLEDDPVNLAVLDSLDNAGNGGIITDPNNPGGNGWINQSGGVAYNFFPNPVDTNLYVEYMLEQEGKVSIALYDMAGRQLKGIVEKNQQKGIYQEAIDCNELMSGNYILRMNFDNQIVNEKIIKK